MGSKTGDETKGRKAEEVRYRLKLKMQNPQCTFSIHHVGGSSDQGTQRQEGWDRSRQLYSMLTSHFAPNLFYINKGHNCLSSPECSFIYYTHLYHYHGFKLLNESNELMHFNTIYQVFTLGMNSDKHHGKYKDIKTHTQSDFTELLFINFRYYRIPLLSKIQFQTR